MYIKTCHTCQISGKPNQSIAPAPLFPISAICQPFNHLIIDCVGPLPRSRSGSIYLLTVMCQTTRYPAAYPLRTITARAVVCALTHFIFIFGIPKIIQTDQGSNFSSHVFSQVLKQLHIRTTKLLPTMRKVRAPWKGSIKLLSRCVLTALRWREIGRRDCPG